MTQREAAESAGVSQRWFLILRQRLGIRPKRVRVGPELEKNEFTKEQVDQIRKSRQPRGRRWPKKD